MKILVNHNIISKVCSSYWQGQFESINGYSNLYIGWGMEDNDFTTRIRIQGLVVVSALEWISRSNNSLKKRLPAYERAIQQTGKVIIGTLNMIC